MYISDMTIDPTANLQIRPTDNSLKNCDIEPINQEPKLLELDENGVPIGMIFPRTRGGEQ